MSDAVHRMPGFCCSCWAYAPVCLDKFGTSQLTKTKRLIANYVEPITITCGLGVVINFMCKPDEHN